MIYRVEPTRVVIIAVAHDIAGPDIGGIGSGLLANIVSGLLRQVARSGVLPPFQQAAAVKTGEREGGSDCSRIFGLVVERLGLRAMRESARGEPIAGNGLDGPAKLSASPRVGQNRFALTAGRVWRAPVGITRPNSRSRPRTVRKASPRHEGVKRACSYSLQLSILSPGILSKWLVLLVTRIPFDASAMAPMRRSASSSVRPTRSRSALIFP